MKRLSLQKLFFSNYMLFGARHVAQIHVADELSNSILDNEDAQRNTLHSDGNSKKGHSYLKYDFNKADGTTFVAGLKVVSTTFLLVCFLCLKESNCQTTKNVFYFTLKALFVMEKTKF